MKSSYTFWVIFWFGLIGSLIAKTEKALLKIEYLSPEINIYLENRDIVCEKKISNYGHSPSAMPDSIQIKKTNFHLNRKTFQKLEKMIKKEEFQTLDPEYGAPKEERNYSYTIHIEYNKKTKSIIYRSNPMYGSAPQEFSDLEKTLLDNCK